MPVAPVRSTADAAGRRVSGGGPRARRRTYFTVEQSAAIHQHYFSLEFELFTTLAGAIPLFGDLDAKCGLSHHLHSAMLRTRAIRDRLSDFLMREPEKQVLVEWANFTRHLMAAPTPGALLSALYRVIRPAQLAAYEAHHRLTLPVNDAPTREMLAMHLPLLREDLAWGSAHLAARDAAGADGPDAAFEQALRAHFRALGGPMGVERPEDAPEPERYPAWSTPSAMALDGFELLSADRYTLPGWPEYEAIPTAYTHFTELPVIDIVGTIVFDGRAAGLPFEFFADFTRQLWDEARHTLMGMERLQAFGVDPRRVPIPVGHYAVWANIGLLHRLASLTQVGEACSFAPKRAWVAAAWARRDPLSALEHEYDIVDERTHVMFGARWIKELMRATGEKRTVKQVVQDADWEFRERINALRKEKGEKWAEDLGERFQGCGTNTSPVSLAPALDGIPNIIA
ncbi:MAG: DUF455 family protein [Chthonomonadales bacterium]|nr:DUF455 family protein [Chthonomonadales bacterium]